MQLGHHAEALSQYARLFKQYPNGGMWGEYGRAAVGAGEFELAESIWQKVRSIEPNSVELLSRLAVEHQNIGLNSKARALYLEAAKLEPRNLDAQLGLARFLIQTGANHQARLPVARSLELDPRNELARLLSAQLDHRENKLAEAENQLRDMLAAGVKDATVRYCCHYELANLLDRTDRFDEAMAQVAEAKNLARQAVDVQTESRAFVDLHENAASVATSFPKNILETWTKSFPQRAQSVAPRLAFLGGPSLSGFTILDEMLGAPASVAACDESQAFQKSLAALDARATDIPSQRLNAMRERYLKIFRRQTEVATEGRLLLDKNPPLTIFLPAFLRAFPELRVIIALRDPRDTILDLYFQTNSTYLTLENLAHHYCCVMDAWLAMRQWEGLAALEIRRENLRADLAKQSRRMREFLGLSHGEERARVEETKASNRRWHSYEKHLAPILAILEPYGRKLGYE